ncbi:hypothetical protein BJV82DRAFT_600991 [Fennellomyces sp. T-0311]|nr:hypothetical protein BJV82DRAFT_600991 [Fennellomyces sp. T-0311]
MEPINPNACLNHLIMPLTRSINEIKPTADTPNFDTGDLNVVLSCHHHKAINIPVRVGAYAIGWMNSDMESIVETYTGFVRGYIFPHLLGIKAILSRCPPERSVNIVGTDCRLQTVFDKPIPLKERQQGVDIMKAEVQRMIEERPGSVHLYSLKTCDLISQEMAKSINNIALAVCWAKRQEEPLLSNNLYVPEPIPFPLTEAEIRVTERQQTIKRERLARRRKAEEIKRQHRIEKYYFATSARYYAAQPVQRRLQQRSVAVSTGDSAPHIQERSQSAHTQSQLTISSARRPGQDENPFLRNFRFNQYASMGPSSASLQYQQSREFMVNRWAPFGSPWGEEQPTRPDDSLQN